MATKTRPSNLNGGVDYRIDATERSYEDFSASVYAIPSRESDEFRSRCVEVQAYLPSRSGGGFGSVAVVAIVLHSGFGLADLMLSPNEAREVAIALIQSAAEADALSHF